MIYKYSECNQIYLVFSVKKIIYVYLDDKCQPSYHNTIKSQPFSHFRCIKMRKFLKLYADISKAEYTFEFAFTHLIKAVIIFQILQCFQCF